MKITAKILFTFLCMLSTRAYTYNYENVSISEPLQKCLSIVCEITDKQEQSAALQEIYIYSYKIITLSLNATFSSMLLVRALSFRKIPR